LWILLERDDGVAVVSGRPYANNLHLAPEASPFSFYRPDALSATQPPASKH